MKNENNGHAISEGFNKLVIETIRLNWCQVIEATRERVEAIEGEGWAIEGHPISNGERTLSQMAKSHYLARELSFQDISGYPCFLLFKLTTQGYKLEEYYIQERRGHFYKRVFKDEEFEALTTD